MTETPYNPLEKANLARSIEIELLAKVPTKLGAVGDVRGAGIYVIYYSGGFEPYSPIRANAATEDFDRPIYVGKAIPKGGRKGGLNVDASVGVALRDRLAQHAKSVDDVSNLRIEDFWVRHLVVDDIWIPLGENMLIETFQPLWNRAIDGFGNKDPGARRVTQYRSPWDVLHPGRFANRALADSGVSAEFLVARVADYFAGRTLAKLPKKLEDQLSEADEGENAK
jgi:hypothetical protein